LPVRRRDAGEQRHKRWLAGHHDLRFREARPQLLQQRGEHDGVAEKQVVHNQNAPRHGRTASAAQVRSGRTTAPVRRTESVASAFIE
jgi:hypothetical protein